MTASARLARLHLYRGKKVLVTGHTGFKGGWLTQWLDHLGATVCGFSRAVSQPGVTSGSSGESRAGDVRDPAAVASAIHDFQPDIVFHLAARSLVADGRTRPLDTIAVNVLGTAAVIDGIRQSHRPIPMVAVSSDKCYAPIPTVSGYGEDDRLGGVDVYSASKACMEIVIEAYRRTVLPGTGIRIASTRAGNVIGGGDWSPGRLVPDIVRSAGGEPAILRAPQGVRPWQHVLEALGGYLLVGAALLRNEPDIEGAWNFGPNPTAWATVRDVAEMLSVHIGGHVVIDGSAPITGESRDLRILSAKAKALLSWQPVWDLRTAINRTANWYAGYNSDAASAAELRLTDIRDYEAAAAEVWQP